MLISEKNIEKALDYFDSIDDAKFEKLVDNILEEQAYLSTFFQQNLDHFFTENEEIKDFAYNLYFTVLYVYKSKSKNYEAIDDTRLNKTIEKGNTEHNQEELGDFIYTQLVESDFAKDDFMKVLGLLNVVILCMES